MDITITINENINAQTVYCKQMDAFLQIYTLAQTDIDNQVQVAQTKISDAQKIITAFANLAAVKLASQ